jgi:hypothetical protein
MAPQESLGEKKFKIRAYCRRCRHEQVFVRSKMHHRVHLLFSVLTFGLWAVSWLSIYLGHLYRPWRCEHCGWHKPEFPDDPSKKSGDRDEPAGTSGGRMP